MGPDAFDLMQGLRGEIALPAVRTREKGNPLYNEQTAPPPKAARDQTSRNAAAAAERADVERATRDRS